MAAVRHLGFSKVRKFNCLHPSGAKTRHHAKFCANLSRHCGDMAVFDFSRWRPSAILDFKKLEILTARTPLTDKMRHRTKFCADRSNRCGDMAVYNFSRWRPSAILDFKMLLYIYYRYNICRYLRIKHTMPVANAQLIDMYCHRKTAYNNKTFGSWLSGYLRHTILNEAVSLRHENVLLIYS